MKRIRKITIILCTVLVVQGEGSHHCGDDWGFYAHKLINRMAIFTLPGEMIEFYKNHIDYIAKHAIDPDKRRYAVRGEAIRHYIDLDHWGADAMEDVPRDLKSAILKYNPFYIHINGQKILLFDTLQNPAGEKDTLGFSKNFLAQSLTQISGISVQDLLNLWTGCSVPLYDPEEWRFESECLKQLFPFIQPGDIIEIEDRFFVHGILPYNLERVYNQLVDAFKTRSVERILRLSADIGHYVGDAHVPLHTTKNYNGQLSNQDGIHAFWESRIPELFAEEEFDFLVGPAEYKSDIRNFIWQFIAESHRGVDLVLETERTVSRQVPADQQYCFDERLGAITKIQCRDYAAKYHELLDKQVEQRMRDCILNLGSIWMSAWVDAGQPDLSSLLQIKDNFGEIEQDSILKKNLLHSVRPHE